MSHTIRKQLRLFLFWPTCAGLAALTAFGADSATIAVRTSESGSNRIAVEVGGGPFIQSPSEGLWSVATDWTDGWPSGWVHTNPESVERSGDWTVVSGKLPLPGGVMEVRDAYRLDQGLVRGVRRWTWTGKEPLPRATLSVRWIVPGAVNAKPMMPGVVIYGNPAGEKTGNHAVTVHAGKPGDKTFFEEHRFAAPWTSIEWKDGEVFRAAAMHTLPSPASGANQNDQWWTLGLISGESATELAALSGPTAANHRHSVTKALQGKFLDYPDTWLNLRPGAIVEKTFWLEVVPQTVAGGGFRQPLRTAMRLQPIGSTEGLPGYDETIREKHRFALSRWRDRDPDAGFEMYPDTIKGTQYVMGWCGQAEAAGYAMLALANRVGDPKMLDRGQRALDWLTHSPFNDRGFLLNYDADTGQWKDQDPVSQGQAMEVFARAVIVGRKISGVKTERWEEFLKKACTVQAKRVLQPDWHPRNTAEAFFVSPLCQGFELFGNEDFKRAAVKAGEYYAKRHLDMAEPYWGGTLDANCEDKEGAWAAFQAFLALYELTHEPRYLDWAAHAMDVTLSYTVLWDIDLPAGRLRDHGLKTRGWTIVSAQNQHLDVFGVMFTPEIWRMGDYLGRDDLKRLAAVMYRSCGQLMDPYGSSGEQIQHTNFGQHGDMSNVFRLRGGYSESWTVFWITAHFLNAASEFERMGVDLDHVEESIAKTSPAIRARLDASAKPGAADRPPPPGPPDETDQNVHVRFREVDTLFTNPGQGWMSQQRSPRGEPRFPCSVVYVRFNWADAEPAPGQFNWKLIDDVIAAWQPRGAAVALRVMTANAHSAGYYTSPKWLFDAGCKSAEYLVGGDDPTSGGQRIPRLEPDYADPIYLEKHGAFLKALGERYDGRPDVEFLDIGSYGIWGEWHTKNPAPVAVRKQIVDLYLQAFRKTPLVFMSDDAEVLDYALAHGTGFRRDGVGSPWHEENWIGSKKYAGVTGMADTWKRAPIVFEWFGDYAYLQSRQWSFDAAVDFMLRNHVTLINDNIGRIPPEAMHQLEKLARLAGARLVLRELAHERTVRRGAPLQLQMTWANVGVGKLYRPCALRFFLLDATGKPAFTWDAKADPRDWLPGERHLAESLPVPATLKAGEYRLAVAVVDRDEQRRPFRLAIDAPEHQGRYELSKVSIQ